MVNSSVVINVFNITIEILEVVSNLVSQYRDQEHEVKKGRLVWIREEIKVKDTVNVSKEEEVKN